MKNLIRFVVITLILTVAACSNEPDPVPVEEMATKIDPSGNVRILRDEYGVPHIFADTLPAVFYGYGYAAAEDRLFQLEMTLRSSYGEVAEVLGEKYLDFDIKTRKYYDTKSIQDQVSQLPAERREILEAYASGVNAQIDRILAEPDTLLSREFHTFDFLPRRWQSHDVVMLFVGPLIHRFGDFNSELESAAMLAQLEEMHGMDTARAIYDAINPHYRETAPTSFATDNQVAARSSTTAPTEVPLGNAAKYARSPETLRNKITSASNAMAIGKSRAEGANAILLNGPQFGWFSPSYVYSVGLHTDGFNIVGVSPFASPIILLGQNGSIAWGNTYGGGDGVDIYRLELNPDNPLQYRYKEEWRDFTVREETFDSGNGVSVSEQLLASIHGPVIIHDPADGTAYAKKRAWEGNEVRSFFAVFDSTQSTNFDDWIASLSNSSTSINWFYADMAGNIGHAYTGHYPERVAGHDNRLPANGDGSMDWASMQPFDSNPRVLNPPLGVIANWNNKPTGGTQNSDMVGMSWSRADRVEVLQKLLAEQEQWSADALWELLKPSSFADPNAAYLIPQIEQALADSEDALIREMVDRLVAWDQISRDDNEDGFYDGAATVIFRHFLTGLLQAILADDMGDTFKYIAYTGHPTAEQPTASGTNVQTGTKVVVDALNGENPSYDFLNGEPGNALIASVMENSAVALREKHGDELDNWRDPIASRPYSYMNFLGIPQTTEDAAVVGRIEQNRGTENNMYVLNDNGIVGYEVVPPGQSGFLPPDDSENPHRTDQMELYKNFGRKRIWYTEAEVRENMQSETLLTY